MASDDLRGIPVAPLTGVLDARSTPSDIPRGSLRMRQNLRTVGQGKLRRGQGWTKLLTKSNYNNTDFHDQLLTFTAGSVRQPPTLLFSAESTRKVKSLILGTQTRLFKLNEFSGNWRMLGDGFGGTASTSALAPRFKAAQLGDYLVVTNDYDKPQYHQLEGNAVNAPALMQPFADLDLIGLSKAKVVWVWKNCLFFADVEMDQERFSHRLLWSNYNDPTSFDPAKVESITGRKDLYSHERILAGGPAGNAFLIYTTHGIWEMSVVGGTQSFAFRRIYNGEDNEGAVNLKYPNTLVVLPDAHAYMAEDGVYVFSQAYGQPERVEWLHRATSLLYDSIDANACDVHFADYANHELLFCVARTGAANQCPDITLRVNMLYRAADVIDHGFTAISSYRSSPVPTIRDFIISNRICTAAGLVAEGYPYVDEGLPRPLPTGEAAFEPQSFYTSTPQTIDGVTTEDWNQEEADEDSLCALLGDQKVDADCRLCEGPNIVVACSSEDWCLKQFGDAVFYRERCANPTAVGTTSADGYTSSVGSYILDGYDSILRFAPLFGVNDETVQAEEFRVDYLAQPQTPASSLSLRIGISAQAVDPNAGSPCGIVWHQHSLQEMKCLTSRLEAVHLLNNTAPSEYHSWAFYREGRVLHFELKLSGTGGDALFTMVRVSAKLKKTRNY